MFGNCPSCFVEQIKRLNGTIAEGILLNKCNYTCKNLNTSSSYEAKQTKTPNLRAIGSIRTTLDVNLL